MTSTEPHRPSPSRPGRTHVPLWKKLVLAAGSLVMAALVSEGAARLLLEMPAPVRLKDGVYVTQLAMVNGRDTVPRTEGSRLERQKRPGEIRVFVFGESSVEGGPWGYFASPVTMLRDHLRSAMPNRDITVINMGRGASTTLDAYYFLLSIERFAPDVVVFYQGGNDFFHGDRERCLPSTHPRLHAAWRGLVEHSHLLWSLRALGPAAYARDWSNAPPTGSASVSAPLCDERRGFRAWSDILATTATRMRARVIVTTPVQNPLRWPERDARWGVAQPLRIAGKSESYRRLLACVLSPDCDLVTTFRAEQIAHRYAPAWVGSHGTAWRASAASVAAPVIDFAAYIDRNAAGGLRPAWFVDEVHLSVEGYWALSWLWARQIEALLGGSPFAASAAPLPPPVDRARYLGEVARRSGRSGACILLHDADTYLRANMPLLAAHLALAAVALEVHDASGMAASRAGLTAQLLTGLLRRELDLDPALPALLASHLAEVRPELLSSELREHPDCSTVGGPLLAPIAVEPQADSTSGSFVIHGGQDAVVMSMLGAHRVFDGCTLDRATIPLDHVHAEFRCAAGPTVVVEMFHPSRTANVLATTQRFVITAGPRPPSARFVEQLAASIREREGSFEWTRASAAPNLTTVTASRSSASHRARYVFAAVALAAAIIGLRYWRRRRGRA